MAKVLWHRCVSHAMVQHGYGTKLSVMSCHKMVMTQECVTVSNVKAQNGYNLYDAKITFHVATVLWHREVSVVALYFNDKDVVAYHVYDWKCCPTTGYNTVVFFFLFFVRTCFVKLSIWIKKIIMPGRMVDLSPPVRREEFHVDKPCFDFEAAKWLIMENVSVYLLKLLTMTSPWNVAVTTPMVFVF